MVTKSSELRIVKEEIKKIIPAGEAGIYCFRYVRNLQSDKHIHAFRR